MAQEFRGPRPSGDSKFHRFDGLAALGRARLAAVGAGARVLGAASGLPALPARWEDPWRLAVQGCASRPSPSKRWEFRRPHVGEGAEIPAQSTRLTRPLTVS